jgi:DNA-binding transcriptional MocR family regulator
MLAELRATANRWVRTMSARSQTPIDLLKGWPNPGLLPPNHLKEASDAALSDPRVWTPGLAYGPDDGYLPLRRELAKWLTSFYQPKDAIEIGRICVTGGASQNLACLLQTFTDAIYTRNVWMVVPTYYLACRIFDDAGFAGKTRGVPEDEEGVDVEFLSKQLQRSEALAREERNFEPVGDFHESQLKKLAETRRYTRN